MTVKKVLISGASIAGPAAGLVLERKGMSRIQAPTLILHGEHDPVVTVDTARFMAEHINGAELKLIPNARHGFTIQYRHRIAEIVRDFVLKNAATKAR